MFRTIKATKVSHFCGTPSIILGSEGSCLNFARDIHKTKDRFPSSFIPHTHPHLLGAVQRCHVWAFTDEWQQSSHFLSCLAICRLHILQQKCFLFSLCLARLHGHLGLNQMLKKVGFFNQRREMLRKINIPIVKMRMFGIHKDIWSLGFHFFL